MNLDSHQLTEGVKPNGPLTSDGQWVRDADGQIVLTCSELFPEDRCELWDPTFIDANPHFMCPKCGRIGIRMEEARAEGRNLNVKQELKEQKGDQ